MIKIKKIITRTVQITPNKQYEVYRGPVSFADPEYITVISAEKGMVTFDLGGGPCTVPLEQFMEDFGNTFNDAEMNITTELA